MVAERHAGSRMWQSPGLAMAMWRCPQRAGAVGRASGLSHCDDESHKPRRQAQSYSPEPEGASRPHLSHRPSALPDDRPLDLDHSIGIAHGCGQAGATGGNVPMGIIEWLENTVAGHSRKVGANNPAMRLVRTEGAGVIGTPLSGSYTEAGTSL